MVKLKTKRVWIIEGVINSREPFSRWSHCKSKLLSAFRRLFLSKGLYFQKCFHIDRYLSNAITKGSNYHGYNHNFVFGMPLSRFISWLSVFGYLSNLLASMFHCWGHAMSQIHIIFFALSSRVKSGLLAIVVLRRWNSKSHNSYLLCLDK